MNSAHLGARGLGGKKTELTANRFHGAQAKYAPPLRHALDDKPAKLRHIAKNFFVCIDQLMVRTNKYDHEQLKTLTGSFAISDLVGGYILLLCFFGRALHRLVRHPLFGMPRKLELGSG
jgi:hypothetical protein